MARDGSIFGASDRLLSFDLDDLDDQYEPPQAKIYHAGDQPLAVLWAGDSTLQSDVVQRLNDCVNGWRDAGGTRCTVRDLVDAYRTSWSAAYREHVEASALHPLGTSFDELKTRTDLAPAYRRMVADAISEFRTSDEAAVELILSGVDDTGPHLWQAWNNRVIARDHDGYAIVGSGAEFARPYIMAMGYSRFAPPAAAVWVAYAAKQIAQESDPYVGPETDVFMIALTAERSQYVYWPPSKVAYLRSLWDRIPAPERATDRAAHKQAIGDLLRSKVGSQAAADGTSKSKPTISESDQT